MHTSSAAHAQVVKKEGGKKGAELAGAADMGGIEYFTTVTARAGGLGWVCVVCSDQYFCLSPAVWVALTYISLTICVWSF